MSESYDRERQNNEHLSALSSKVSALRSVTLDIYDNAQDQQILDHNNSTFSSMSTSLKSSAARMSRMAAQGNKVAILKLAGCIVGIGVVGWWVLGYFL